MSRTTRQLLAEFTVAAARTALQAPQFTGQNIDPAGFAHANRPQMMQLIARLPRLRAELAEEYRADLADANPTLQALTGTDQDAADAAAVTLANPAHVRRLTREQARRAAAPATPGDTATASTGEAGAATGEAEQRRERRLDRRIAEVRAARNRALGQRDHALTELKTARQELTETIGDRDEALAIVDALRVELSAERQAATTQAADVRAAARLLAALAGATSDFGTSDLEVDGPRPAEHAAAAGPDGDPGRLAAALTETGMSGEAFAAVLQVLAAPPAPPPAPATTEAREIAVTPLGGGTDIGGSCMLVTAGQARILIDAGMRPKHRIDRAGPPDIALARDGHLDAIVITHAHNDHAGYVPALTADYPNLPVLCTADTAALLPVMWNDSVKVFNQTRSEYVEEGEPPAEPPYTDVQALAAQRRIRAVEYSRTVEVVDGVTIELFPAGHILGAAGVVVTAGASRVTVTGDVSDLAQASVGGLIVPDAARGSHLLVIESTYCGPEVTNRTAEVDKFVRMVDETVSAGGRVLVPAFALGRAQEVVLTLRDRLPDVPVLVDGMAKEITRIYEEQTAGTDRPLRIYSDNIRAVAPDMRTQELRTFRRGVIVTTSGMLTAGPAVRWARLILPDPEAALLVAGYQDAESPGYELLALAESSSAATFRLDGDDIAVNARVAKFGLSAHADRRGLSAIIGEVSPRQVMLVHGVPFKQRGFAENLTRRGYTVAPTRHWQSCP